MDGVEAGADDYLIKPFSARELLARVESHVKMARFRRESEAALRESEGRYRQANVELAGRLSDLQKATAEIHDSRRAAMNLMQDAVLAREQVEKLNQDLRLGIREREAAHKLLRQRTAQFETLLNQAPLGVYVVDANFRVRDVNPPSRWPSSRRNPGPRRPRLRRGAHDPLAARLRAGSRQAVPGTPLRRGSPTLRPKGASAAPIAT